MANLSSYLPGGIDPAAVTITGGTINGTTIGASTAAAGTFTTFTSNGIDDNADAVAITIDSSENVGIGTTTPSSYNSAGDNLVVVGSGNTGMSIVSGSSSSGTIYFADGTSGSETYRSFIEYTHSDDALKFGTAGSARMYIASDGNVGIGTISPSDRLHVKNGSAGSVPAHSYTQINVEHSSHAAIQLSTPNGSEAGIMWADPQDSDAAGILYYHASDFMYFRVNAAETMRIDAGGNLLVGRTSTPSGIAGGSICIQADISHKDNAGTDRLLYDRSADMLGNAGTNVTCATLSKSSGSFKIDHPLPEKTETHHLVHSFVEAPQADNIYRGTVALVDGTATVNLDTAGRMSEGTFVLLNTNIQCFTTNESGWTAVKGSVSGNVLTITAKESCDDTVSWLVVGERCDTHMINTDWTDESGRIITEPLKGA